MGYKPEYVKEREKEARLAALREMLAWVSSTGLRINKQNMEMRLMSLIKREESGKLTKQRVTECIALSGEDFCQACGVAWKDHEERCTGSATLGEEGR